MSVFENLAVIRRLLNKLKSPTKFLIPLYLLMGHFSTEHPIKTSILSHEHRFITPYAHGKCNST